MSPYDRLKPGARAATGFSLSAGLSSSACSPGCRSATPNVQVASGLGNSFDRPVSSYSQGMRARLGFATADEANPTILLLDEVHEALDQEYRAIVQERAREILAAGGIVVAAGHDHPLLEQLSSRALWLDEGSIIADGPFEDVRTAYLEVAPEPALP